MRSDLVSSRRIAELTSTNRRMIADVLDTLDDRQWQSPSLCDGWTVHHVAAHLLQPMLVGFPRFFLTSLRHRGDTDRTIDAVTRRLARRPRSEVIELLRRHADDHVSPPRVGPMGPFAETCVHLRDIARPLGLRVDVPTDHWRILLAYLVGPDPAPALVRPGWLTGVELRATDVPWHGGRGTELTGPAEALGMAATGRAAALDDLDGPGVAILRQRLAGRR